MLKSVDVTDKFSLEEILKERTHIEWIRIGYKTADRITIWLKQMHSESSCGSIRCNRPPLKGFQCLYRI